MTIKIPAPDFRDLIVNGQDLAIFHAPSCALKSDIN